MHPIERLRYVARSQGAPPDVLVREAAMALGAFRDDPAGMVAACRRIIDRQLTCGPLWWLCARMLCAPEPMREAHEAVEEMDADPTAVHLASELPEGAVVVVVGWPMQSAAALRRRGDVEVLVIDVAGEAIDVAEQLERMDVEATDVATRNASAAVAAADLVLLEAHACGPSGALVPAGSTAVAGLARLNDVPVWLVAGVGRLMPDSMIGALRDRWLDAVDPLQAVDETMGLEVASMVAGIGGVLDVADALRSTDCPVAPELFRLVG